MRKTADRANERQLPANMRSAVAENAGRARRAAASLAPEIRAVARTLWEHPEPSGAEEASARTIAGFLQAHGFTVKVPAVVDLPTSFVAEKRVGAAGAGLVIGLLAEYDALPNMAQDACPERRLPAGAGPESCGHGCGHNLLGAGSAGAAVAAVRVLEEANVPATVRLFGCPAEETLTGKGIMARAGVFDGLDACFSWHPMPFTGVSVHEYAALVSKAYRFHGVAGHAAMAPDRARSATDACELFGVGVNYLREHLPGDAVVAYAPQTGAGSPNVIADRADVWCHVRAFNLDRARRIEERVDDVARGAALMSGTTVSQEALSTCASTLLVPKLNDLVAACLEAVPAPPLTEGEAAFARAVRSSLGADARQVQRAVDDDCAVWGVDAPAGRIMADDSVDYSAVPVRIAGASDYSEVSQRVPCAQAWIASAPLGTPAHSWQNTACAGSPLGMRAPVRAAAVLGCAVAAAASEPAFIDAVKDEFNVRGR